MVTVSGNTFGGGATMVTITDDGGGTVTPASSATSPFSFSYTPTSGDAGKVVIITVTTDNPVGDPCAAASATYALTVNAIPPAPVPGTVTHPTCLLPTGSVMLNNLPASGEWTITRSPGDTKVTGSGTSITVTGLAPDTYTFTVTNALGCTSPASANVVINTQPATPGAPVVDFITQPTCALSTGSVTLSGLPAVGTWILTRSPGNVTTTGTGTTRTVTGINPGNYTYTVTNASGCVSPASDPVVINPQPITPNTPTIGTITHPTCELATGSIVLENMPEEGEWILIRYPGGITSTGTGSSITISSLPTGIYNFAVTNSDGCTSQVSANAVINAQPPTPTPPVVGTITHPTFTVATGSVVLSGLPSTGIWTLTRYPDGFTSQGTGTTRTVSGLEPGTYTFTVTNSLGCTSAPTGDVVINARPGAPVVVINNPPTICSNETADLTSASVTAGSDANLIFTYWTDAAATIAYGTPTEAPAGTYYIKGTSTAGYYSIKEVVVTADQLPVAYAGTDQELNYVFGTTLNADIPEIGSGIWELVTGTGDLFNSAAPSTFVSGLSEGENVFSWTVTNGACDPVSDNVIINVNNLKIPTLITPNQDGRNDSFRLLGLETLGRTELIIFDRRGLKVYENSDYDNSWEGLDYNNSPLPDDTYFYIISAENGVKLSGYIVIRR
jgi:gliding motility-associated-like protein